jgi:indole-3-glycerol phosphate synthase
MSPPPSFGSIAPPRGRHRSAAAAAGANRPPEVRGYTARIVGFLSDVVTKVRRDLERNPLDDSVLMSRVAASPPPRDFLAAIRSGSPAFIAEIKRASPSAGPIADANPHRMARDYEEAGAAAISVLTEPKHFDGSLSDLRAAHLGCRIPVLRKDFLVHPAQLIEARAHGADAVQLIAACLTNPELEALLRTSSDLGMAAVVEAHSEEDLGRVLDTEAEIVGVNARDLESLEVDEGRALELARRVPSERTVVFESGISRREQVARAVEAGAAAVLVGEALMRARNPGAKLRQLRGELAPVEP